VSKNRNCGYVVCALPSSLLLLHEDWWLLERCFLCSRGRTNLWESGNSPWKLNPSS